MTWTRCTAVHLYLKWRYSLWLSSYSHLCWWLSASLDMATSRLKWVITRGWAWSALPSISWSDSSFSHPTFNAITVAVNETKNLILSGLSFQQMIHTACKMNWSIIEPHTKKNVHAVYFLGYRMKPTLSGKDFQNHQELSKIPLQLMRMEIRLEPDFD